MSDKYFLENSVTRARKELALSSLIMQLLRSKEFLSDKEK